jgi:uncharacterized sulfatase
LGNSILYTEIRCQDEAASPIENCARSTAIFALVLISLFAYAEDGTGLQQAPARPNVVIILADDLGYGDIGAYGATRIKTPHIDRLAASGMRFTQGYASANVCSPSRAGLLTGRYAIRSGLAWKVVEANSTNGLPESEETISELVRRAGYKTMLVGKWHLGHLPEYSPLKHGFVQFFGVPHSNDMPDFALFDGEDLIEKPVDQSTLTFRYTEKAVKFIADNSSEPFLLLVSHTFPHIPLYASDDFYGSSAAGLYGDTVEELDWSTGRIVSALREAGVLDNTIVVFTSDNGPFFEGSTAGLKGRKGNSWEGGYRVPFIVFWPKVIEAGRVSDIITMNIDVLPTISNILGIDPVAKEIDGRSLLPVLRGSSKPLHDHIYFFNNENIVGLRTQNWKYVTHGYYTGRLAAFEKVDQLPGFELPYDMLLDAHGINGEAYSYADRHPDVIKALKAALHNARNEFYPLRTRPSEETYPE